MQAKNKIQRKIIAYTPVFLCFRDDLNLVNLLKFNGEFLANYIHIQEIIVRYILKSKFKISSASACSLNTPYTKNSQNVLKTNHCIQIKKIQ